MHEHLINFSIYIVSLIELRSLREEARNGNRQISAKRGSLMAAVLQHDPDAFSYNLSGKLGLLFIIYVSCRKTIDLRDLYSLLIF